jgi:hypothetical protein
MKFKELLDKGTAAIATDGAVADKDAVDVVHSLASSEVFQVIFDRGHSTGLAKGKTGVTEVETKFETEKKRADAAEQQLKDFKEKHPDAAKLQEKYQSDLAAVQRDNQAALTAKDAQIDKERRRRARSEFVAELKGLGVDGDYAEVLADKPENTVRIKFNAEGETEVLQSGKDIAIVPTAEKGALGMLATEIFPKVPAKFVVSKAGGGGGTQEERGGAGGKKNNFADIRQKELDRQAALRPQSTASERLSGRARRDRERERDRSKK